MDKGNTIMLCTKSTETADQLRRYLDELILMHEERRSRIPVVILDDVKCGNTNNVHWIITSVGNSDADDLYRSMKRDGSDSLLDDTLFLFKFGEYDSLYSFEYGNYEVIGDCQNKCLDYDVCNGYVLDKLFEVFTKEACSE